MQDNQTLPISWKYRSRKKREIAENDGLYINIKNEQNWCHGTNNLLFIDANYLCIFWSSLEAGEMLITSLLFVVSRMLFILWDLYWCFFSNSELPLLENSIELTFAIFWIYLFSYIGFLKPFLVFSFSKVLGKSLTFV